MVKLKTTEEMNLQMTNFTAMIRLEIFAISTEVLWIWGTLAMDKAYFCRNSTLDQIGNSKLDYQQKFINKYLLGKIYFSIYS